MHFVVNLFFTFTKVTRSTVYVPDSIASSFRDILLIIRDFCFQLTSSEIQKHFLAREKFSFPSGLLGHPVMPRGLKLFLNTSSLIELYTQVSISLTQMEGNYAYGDLNHNCSSPCLSFIILPL